MSLPNIAKDLGECQGRHWARQSRCSPWWARDRLAGVLAARDGGIAHKVLQGVWGPALRQTASGGPPDVRGRAPAPVVPERLPVLRSAVAACFAQPGHAAQLTQALQVRTGLGRWKM